MLIDWFTVVAQVVNFLILVWLLKRFLYRPILNAIDAREQRIATELAEADAKKAEATQERNDYARKNEEFDKQRSAHLNQAIAEAKLERQRLLDTARQESDNLRVKRQQALQSEQRSLNAALSLRARDEVFAIAGKALADLADATLESRMTDIFLQRLAQLNDVDKTNLRTAFKTATDELRVRTAFDLPIEQRSAIDAAIKATLGKEKQVQFETVPELLSGIEISAGGQKIAWSLADYLTSLSNSVDSLLKTPGKEQSGIEDRIPGKKDTDEK